MSCLPLSEVFVRARSTLSIGNGSTHLIKVKHHIRDRMSQKPAPNQANNSLQLILTSIRSIDYGLLSMIQHQNHSSCYITAQRTSRYNSSGCVQSSEEESKKALYVTSA